MATQFSIEGSASLPSSMDTIDCDAASVEMQVPTTEGSATTDSRESLELQRKQRSATPQSPLCTIKVQNSNIFTASCPDISSPTYYNTTINLVDSKELRSPAVVPQCVVHSASTSTDSIVSSHLDKSDDVSEVPPQTKSTSVAYNGSSHTYHKMINNETLPKQPPNIVVHSKIDTSPPAIASGDHAHSVDIIKDQLPHVSKGVIAQVLMRNSGDTEQTIKDIKLQQLTNTKPEDITEADSRIALEQFK